MVTRGDASRAASFTLNDHAGLLGVFFVSFMDDPFRFILDADKPDPDPDPELRYALAALSSMPT